MYFWYYWTKEDISLFDQFSYVALGSLGIFMTLIVGSEPFIMPCKKGAVMEKNSLYAFINSAMNIEFVYIILVGINKFMNVQSQMKGTQLSVNS
jgi:hypothetical protein